jgi:hypothetical protein
VIRFPDERFSVICLANLNSISPTRLALQVADLYLADQFTDQGEPSSPSEAEFTELSPGQIEGMPGFYCNQKHGNILKLSIEEGKLSGEIYGERFVMAATSPTHLAAIETRFDLQIDFEESIPDSPQIIRVRIDEDKSERYQKMAVVPVTSAQLADYTGAYHSDELNITYKVLLDGEQLFLKRGYSPQDNLNPVTQDIFTSRYVDFRFERDERNQVCGFRLGAGRVRNIRFRKH